MPEQEFKFPLLGNAGFIIKRNKIIHIESECCRGHSEKCKCSFCMIHKPYMERLATKLYNFNIKNQEDLKKCGCKECLEILNE